MTTKTTAPLTREQIEKRAAEDAAVLAEFHRQDQEQEQAAARRRAEAQREWDQRFVAGFSRAALEADVDRTRAALDQALAENPLTLALVDHLVALRRRSHALLEHNAALARLGRPTAAASVDTELQRLDEYLLPVASRLATELVAAEMADLHASRDAAGTENTTEENR